MKMEMRLAAPVAAVASAAATLAATFAIAAYMERNEVQTAAPVEQEERSHATGMDAKLIASGRSLFLMNCAHCHADDATGDEGPDLHGLRKTDARLRLIVSNGIKGEMPRFREKLVPSDLDALVAYLNSLR
jgi:mono/diheme cytochrome c family protein